MNCPSCNKDLAVTLSVCPSCGTMVNDSVREELAPKISPIAKLVKQRIQEKAASPVKPGTPIEPAAPVIPVINVSSPAGQQTTEIWAKHTSPILVEFQSKNAVVPEWRLQLQNSVRRRNNQGTIENPPVKSQRVLVTRGSAAVKADPVEQPLPQTGFNPVLENALRRIEKSRERYFVEERQKFAVVPSPSKNISYAEQNPVQHQAPEFFPGRAETAFESSPFAKPDLTFPISQPKSKKFDTNKLPPLPAKVVESFENSPEVSLVAEKIIAPVNTILEIKAGETPDVLAYAEPAATAAHEDEADDRAPMFARFNAGFFDLIIGAFMSFILLAPFTLASGNLFTFQGVLAFLATCSIVMFIYLTTTIGTMGRTFGMRLFSLELIDIEENAYPTFHQAAVSSSVYLVSLAFGGVGFLTLLLNEEKRAAHDLISGTIVVKEYQ